MNEDAVAVTEQPPLKYRYSSAYTSRHGNIYIYIYTAEASMCLDMIDFMATRSIRKTVPFGVYSSQMLRSEARLRQCTPIKDNVLA